MANKVTFVDNSQLFKDAKDEAIEKALEAIGQTAEGYAKLLCPVDTGRLRNDISHANDADTMYVGTNVEYAPYVEYGHSQEVGRYVPAIKKRLVNPFVPGQPFLKPSVTDHIDEYKNLAENYLKNGL